MASPTRTTSRLWLNLLTIVLACTLIAAGARAIYLQTALHNKLDSMGDRQQYRSIHLPGRPGNILARSRGGYVILASSKQVPSAYVDPWIIKAEDRPAVAAKIAAAIGANPEQIEKTLYERAERRFAYVMHDMTEAQAEAIRKLKLRCVGVTYEWRRAYPNAMLAANVIGFRQKDETPGGGLEASANAWLGERDGFKIIRSDASRRGRFANVEEYQPPQDGKHVVLTIDSVIQGYLEQALAEAQQTFGAEAVMGTVMDPSTGQVLAMACVPTFDPNEYPGSTADSRALRTITHPFEPGSSFKPFIAVGAVEMRKATLRSTYFCQYGLWNSERGGTIRDFPGEHFGILPLTEIVIHSSNIGMAKLGESLGNAALYAIAKAFGFGQRTGIELPGESPGRLCPIKDWTTYSTLRMPFGQGPIVVTNLQLATAMSAIANGGTLLKPHIIDRVLDADGSVLYRSEPTRVRRVLSPSLCRQFIDEALVQVVERGTAKKCKLDQYTVFGKTGTGQIGTPHGYPANWYTGTFIGAAPASDPKLVCVISVYKPDYSKGHTGGSVAAPYVKQVLEKALPYLDVPPDKTETFVARQAARTGGASGAAGSPAGAHPPVAQAGADRALAAGGGFE